MIMERAAAEPNLCHQELIKCEVGSEGRSDRPPRRNLVRHLEAQVVTLPPDWLGSR